MCRRACPLPLIWVVLFVLSSVIVAVGWLANYAPKNGSRFERPKALRSASLSNAPSSGMWVVGLVLVVGLPSLMGWSWQEVLACSDWTRPQPALCNHEDIDSVWLVGVELSLLSAVSGLWYLLYEPWA